MKLSDFDHHAVSSAVAAAGKSFRTRDVSEHPQMISAHARVADRNYHAMVARYLSCNQALLGIRFLEDGPAPRGAYWEKVISASTGVAAPAPTPPGASQPASPASSDLGPQYDGDDPFTARMRFHQSVYRARVLGVPCGTGPTPESATRYGNMLRREDGAAGRNFLSPAIFAVVERRLAQPRDRVEPFRLLHNMLSSQPMCFNLFGPLVADPSAGQRLLRALFPGEIERLLDVRIEHAPEPAREYLDDRTSFDAFVDYERPTGERAFLAIETKLTDSFSPKRYDKPSYRRWMTSARPIWQDGVDELVASPRHNQLWRNHLLAIALRGRPGSPYAAGRSVVVRHPLDEDGARSVASYRSLLRRGSDEPTFTELTLDAVLAAFESAAATEDERAWLAAFRVRYVSLESSERAWSER